ncbi:MAG: PEP-CTERM sorting domain-containing protein [Phycisphaerales bacterium]|nr:PEP-CTERM sorting domain-containing protein [Phycisphaerales bacterium]
MSMFRALLGAVAIASICSAGPSNLLSNPSFEDPITTDGPPFVGFWEAFNAGAGSSSAVSTSMPHTGAQSLELTLDGANLFAGVFQDVENLMAGQDVSYTGWHKAVADSGIEIRIEWRDSINNVEVSRTPNFTPAPGSAYEMFMLNSTVPMGADTARVVYAIQSFGGVNTQDVFVDDMSFVPEPASLSLLALGGLLALRRR